MRAFITIITVAGFLFAPAAYAGDYQNLAAQGYRWVLVDGPYACTTEDYLERITAHRTDAAELQVIEEGQCYYLIPGTIVQIIQEDPHRHMSLMRMGSVSKSLWTYTRFLSPSPVHDTYGMIEMPEDVGLIWPSNPTAGQWTSSNRPADGFHSNSP